MLKTESTSTVKNKPGSSARWYASIKKHQVWFLVLLFLLITSLQVAAALGRPPFLTHLTTNLGLSRYTVERILYLLPIIWAGIAFGWRGGAITATAAMICMLPRALFSSPVREDALVETGLVFVLGNLMAYSLDSLQKERKRRSELESAQDTIKSSEQRYRELFENAHDAIWLQDLDGNIIAANTACEKLTGFPQAELVTMNASEFLTPEFLNTARQVKRTLLEGGVLEQPYEQRLIRKNGSTGILKMATSLVKTRGEVVGFQHIARDVTEETQLHENLHYLLRQVTRAQEEERKRIARELHDDTIQALVVHHHQLWDLVGNIEKLTLETISRRLEELCQQDNNIIGELRRLSQDLRPAALDRFGLMPTLGHLASDLEEKAGVRTKVNLIGEGKRLPAEAELVLFRIVQEALRNIWKHAGATSAEITIEFGDTETRVTVKDNGKGFHVQPVTDNLRDGKLGLAGMRERASLLGGTLKVESAEGKGTTLTTVLPAYISYP
jgi:two-component system sensor histidine kinase DegS